MHWPLPYIKIDNIKMEYDIRTPVIADISMEISKGELVCLYGPNGCGKTTFLKILCGLENQFQGSVTIGDKLPDQVNLSIIPQNIDVALLPWLNIIDNIALPLMVSGLSFDKIRKNVVEFIDKAGINLPLYSYPYRVSGGQKQLAVIIRGLISQPDLLILDEPFTSLDSNHTTLMADALIRLWEFTGTTTILVTHDLLRGVFLSDQIILLSPRPMRIIHSQKISLPRPRSHLDQNFLSLLNKLQQILLANMDEI